MQNFVDENFRKVAIEGVRWVTMSFDENSLLTSYCPLESYITPSYATTHQKNKKGYPCGAAHSQPSVQVIIECSCESLWRNVHSCRLLTMP